MRIEASVIIDRPIGEVFAYATNPNCWPEWVSGVVKVAGGPGERLEVGSTFEQVDTFLGRSRRESWECVEHEPPCVLCCRRITGPDPCAVRLVLISVEGGTKLAICTEGGLGDELGGGPEVERAIMGRSEHDLRKLRHILELRRDVADQSRSVTQIDGSPM